MAACAVISFGVSSCHKNKTQEEGQEQAGFEQPSNAAEMDRTVVRLLDQLTPTDSVAKRPDQLTTTPTGLKYRIVKEGSGKQPAATDAVKVNYEGRLLDGTVFDSSYERNEPAEFPLTGVISGWTEGLQYMKEGAVYEFYIPYNLAYGEMGRGTIPGQADLLFKVELLEVK